MMGLPRLALSALLLLVTALLTSPAAWAGPAEPDSLPGLSSSSPAEISSDATAVHTRLHQEQQASGLLFSIVPHKSNYLLPVSYNRTPNHAAYNGSSTHDESLDNLEVKFQLSIKTPLWENIFGNNGTLYAAYSQLAFWQAYNSKTSSPFREINFEPELFLVFTTGYQLFGVTSQLATIGINHQSNGRSDPLSRSWNRVTASLLFNRGDTYLTLRPWFRIPESRRDDDNPHMERYYGYGELQLLHKIGNHTLTLMLRNNLRRSDNKGAVQLDWSFPLHKKLKGYIQYFNGYGESLVDYNHRNNRISVGVMLTDWL